MKNKKAKNPQNKRKVNKKRTKLAQSSGKKNKFVDLTISPAQRNFHLKRLAKNKFSKRQLLQKPEKSNKSTISSRMPVKGEVFDFNTALNEYRVLRKLDKTNEFPPKMSQSDPIVIDDSDEIEEGEIIDDEPVSSLDKLIHESAQAIQHSKNIRGNDSLDMSNQLIFYEDKNLGNMKVCKAPIYNIDQTKDVNPNESQDVICLDSTNTASDDSIIVISENQSRPTVLRKPNCLSSPAINNLYEKISLINSSNSSTPNQEKSIRKRRTQRTKTYMAKKKLQRLSSLQKQAKRANNVKEQTSIIVNSSNNATNNKQLTISLPEKNADVSASVFNQEGLKLTDTLPSFIPLTSISNNSQVTSSVQCSKTVAIPDRNKELDYQSNSIPTTSTEESQQKNEKRIILIDGSNVAFGYSESQLGKLKNKDGKDFSAEGLKIAIDHFTSRGFQVKAIVPEFRVCRDKSSNKKLMNEMKDAGHLLLTPAKAYDDLMLLQSAKKLNAAIVSNDFFRDIRIGHKEYTSVIEKRQIRYNWIFGEFFLVEDPYGKIGPTLNEILYK